LDIDENQNGSDLIVNGVETSYDWTSNGMKRFKKELR